MQAGVTIENSAERAILAGYELRACRLDELHESPKNPRTYFPEGPLEELAASIRASGVRVPLMGRPRIEGPGIEIGAGHRRFRAAKSAGVSHVPVLVRDMSDLEFAELLAFENGNREDLNVVEQAQAWRMWIDETLGDVAAICQKTGLKQGVVYARLKLLDAVEEARRACIDGRIRSNHLLLIARIPKASDQRTALAYCLPPEWDPDREVVSVRELAEWIKKNLQLSLTDAPFDRGQIYEQASEAGACGVCPHRVGNFPDYDPAQDFADTCTFPACFEEKVKAHIALRLAADPALLKISPRGPMVGTDVLYPNDWHEVQGQGGAPAIFVAGPRAGHEIRVLVQERLTQKPGPASPAAAPPPPTGPAPKPPKPTKADLDGEAEERRAREAEETRRAEEQRQADELAKQELAIRLRIFGAVLEKVIWPPRPEDVAAAMGDDWIADLPEALDGLLEQHGLQNFESIQNLSGTQVARLLLFSSLDREFDEFYLRHACDKLNAAAKHYGVDAAKIRAEMAASAKPPKSATRKEVVKKLPALGSASSKKAPAKKAAPAAKASAPKKTPAKPVPAKKTPTKKASKK